MEKRITIEIDGYQAIIEKEGKYFIFEDSNGKVIKCNSLAAAKAAFKKFLYRDVE